MRDGRLVERIIGSAAIVLICLTAVGCGDSEADLTEANRAIEQEMWDVADEAIRNDELGPRDAVISDMEAEANEVGTMREEDPDTGEIIVIDDPTFWDDDGNLVPYESMNTGQWYAFYGFLMSDRVEGAAIGSDITSLRRRARQLSPS